MLARTVFHCGVREMLARVGADELAEWEAEYAIDPWGEAKADMRHGLACQVAAQAAGAKHAKAVDFIPWLDTAKEKRKETKWLTEQERRLQAMEWVSYAKSVGAVEVKHGH